MPLTLKEAALLAQLSPEDLMIEINKGSLVASEAADLSEDSHLIQEHDLDAFLKKKSFDALWSQSDCEEEHFEETPRGHSVAGNLRRVLTAEAVSELKIQHQVLISRVQTLERLFSEFMDAEKNAENALILEEDWKIVEGAEHGHALSPIPANKDAQNIAEGNEERPDMLQKEQSNVSGSKTLQSNHDVRKAYQLKTNEEESNSKSKNLEAAENKSQKKVETSTEVAESNSGKSLLSMKLKLMKSDEPALDNEHISSNTASVSDDKMKIEEDDSFKDADEETNETGIAERLQEYERRLAHAKQTATQMWH